MFGTAGQPTDWVDSAVSAVVPAIAHRHHREVRSIFLDILTDDEVVSRDKIGFGRVFD